jgi:diphthine-ammonia ligase
MPKKGDLCFCSWSGGKDSCLALFRALGSGLRPTVLLTMLTETGERSRSHGLPVTLLEEQAERLGMRPVTVCTSWDDYEKNFLDAARRFRREGISAGIFGDIDLEQHREWVERVCAKEGIEALLPLWKHSRDDLLTELLSSGFKAVIVSVKEGVLDRDFLGKSLDATVIGDMKDAGIDASGEEGEYHTFVTDGPIFSKPVEFSRGSIHLRDGYHFLDLGISQADQAMMD